MSNRSITFTAGETKKFSELGDFLRILDSTSAITIWFYFNGREVSSAEAVNVGYSERFDTSQFDAIHIYSAGAQTVQIATRLGNRIGYDKPPVGNVAVTASVPLALDAATLLAMESIDLNAASLNTLTRPHAHTGGSSVGGAMVANTPETVFTPAANVNGAILLYAQGEDSQATGPSDMTLIAKASAPAGIHDGAVYLRAIVNGTNGTQSAYRGEVFVPHFIPAGLGLYWISNGATAANSMRSTRYKLL